jgi:hypothetical protein
MKSYNSIIRKHIKKKYHNSTVINKDFIHLFIKQKSQVNE